MFRNLFSCFIFLRYCIEFVSSFLMFSWRKHGAILMWEFVCCYYCERGDFRWFLSSCHRLVSGDVYNKSFFCTRSGIVVVAFGIWDYSILLGSTRLDCSQEELPGTWSANEITSELHDSTVSYLMYLPSLRPYYMSWRLSLIILCAILSTYSHFRCFKDIH